jgi:hypothetical protein
VWSFDLSDAVTVRRGLFALFTHFVSYTDCHWRSQMKRMKSVYIHHIGGSAVAFRKRQKK